MVGGRISASDPEATASVRGAVLGDVRHLFWGRSRNQKYDRKTSAPPVREARVERPARRRASVHIQIARNGGSRASCLGFFGKVNPT